MSVRKRAEARPAKSSGAVVDAEVWLDGLINRERAPRASYARVGLEAIEAVLARIGNPERGLSIAHLAGSKGKGSTALLLEALLQAAGERVGTFTSPHLLRWTERFRIDGSEVDGSALAAVIAILRPHVDALRTGDPAASPSFFDATTAAALLLFARERVDRAVLEVGLGGRLDSTNAVAPAVTCITTIELEHTDKLGTTLAAIAGEKAGIVKPGVPCVMGRLPAEAARVVQARTAELEAPLRRLGRDFGVEVLRDVEPSEPTPIRFWSSDGFRFEARLGVKGRHQCDNAAVAIAAARELSSQSDDALAAAAQQALASASLPGRVEVLEREPWVVVDACHTRDSAAALAEFLSGLDHGPVHLVLSVSQDKALGSILDALLPQLGDQGGEVTVTRAEPVRAMEPDVVAKVVSERSRAVSVHVVPDPHEAVRRARRELPPEALLCVAGSFYLAGIARQVLCPTSAGGDG